MRRIRLPPFWFAALCFVLSVAPYLYQFSRPAEWSLSDDLARARLGMLLVAAITFPAGLLGVGTYLLLAAIFAVGAPTESLVLSAPVFAMAGYMQWYRLVPKAFARSNPNSGSANPDSLLPGLTLSLRSTSEWLLVWFAGALVLSVTFSIATHTNGSLAPVRLALLVALLGFSVQACVTTLRARRNAA